MNKASENCGTPLNHTYMCNRSPRGKKGQEKMEGKTVENFPNLVYKVTLHIKKFNKFQIGQAQWDPHLYTS